VDADLLGRSGRGNLPSKCRLLGDQRWMDFAGIGVEDHRPLVVGIAPARFAGRCPRPMFSGMVN
jgi:hypothetical protein